MLLCCGERQLVHCEHIVSLIAPLLVGNKHIARGQLSPMTKGNYFQCSGATDKREGRLTGDFREFPATNLTTATVIKSW